MPYAADALILAKLQMILLPISMFHIVMWTCAMVKTLRLRISYEVVCNVESLLNSAEKLMLVGVM